MARRPRIRDVSLIASPEIVCVLTFFKQSAMVCNKWKLEYTTPFNHFPFYYHCYTEAEINRVAMGPLFIQG